VGLTHLTLLRIGDTRKKKKGREEKEKCPPPLRAFYLLNEARANQRPKKKKRENFMRPPDAGKRGIVFALLSAPKLDAPSVQSYEGEKKKKKGRRKKKHRALE